MLHPRPHCRWVANSAPQTGFGGGEGKERETGFVANSKYKIRALFKDFQGPKLHFSSTKIINKKPCPRRGHSKFRLQCDTEVYCTVLTNTVMIKAKFARFKFKDFSSTFKHLICFQALSKALKFLFQIQAFSRISQARYEAWAETSHRPMRYVQAAIHCTLHSSKDPRPGRGSSKADV